VPELEERMIAGTECENEDSQVLCRLCACGVRTRENEHRKCRRKQDSQAHEETTYQVACVHLEQIRRPTIT